MPWAPDKSYRNENIRNFNDIIKSVCNKNKVYFVEIFKELIETDYKRLLEDGAHPNPEGHKKIFEIIKDFLIKSRII